MTTLNIIIKSIRRFINKYHQPKLNITRLKEYRDYANKRYECYRNTRIGGYDIFDDKVIFIAHVDTASEARSILNEWRRNCILEQLDVTKKF